MNHAPDLARNALALRWVYRLALGREPEASLPRELLAARLDLDALLASTLTSDEGLAMHDRGHPLLGEWGAAALTEQDVAMVARLRHGAWPSAEACREALSRHADAASLRAEFLASPEFAALQERLEIGQGRATLRIGPHAITLSGRRHDRRFADLAQGAIEPSIFLLERVLRALLPGGGEGAVLVDAGANIGLTGAVMGLGAPGHARLIAVEPDARNTALLRRNLAANGLDRAVVVEAALGAEEGTALFRAPVHDGTTGHVIADLDRSPVPYGEVFVRTPLRRLDAVLAEQGAERLDFLKLDVEGFEPPVLRGAGDWLSRSGGAAFVEVNIWTLMALLRRNPLEVLEEWAAAYPHLVAFGANGDPVPLRGAEGLHWFLHELVTARAGLSDIVICHDLAWLGRWA